MLREGNRNFGGVIFDLDGTLVDTLADIAAAANRVLIEFDQPEYPIEAYRYLVGDGAKVLFERAWPATKNDPTLSRLALESFEKFYSQEWNNRSKPYTGIDNLLECLKSASMKIGVLSNKPHRFTLQCVAHFFPTVSFDSVYGQRDGVRRKPDPAGVFQIAEEWGFSTGRIAYIGDTNTDMETAVASGCCAIGVSWGFRAVSELLDHGARHIVHSSDELASLLLG